MSMSSFLIPCNNHRPLAVHLQPRLNLRLQSRSYFETRTRQLTHIGLLNGSRAEIRAAFSSSDETWRDSSSSRVGSMRKKVKVLLQHQVEEGRHSLERRLCAGGNGKG
ncbi:hypothetical protein MRB53_014115 [Persea americana]|uniref:Uncharacterized protein n=1 Tax=Persea americana TaxID=3435 RepID=A0ACC2K9Y6_PERAE|nr:hypothetical protein MRB53_014115 [Persea americana]